MQCPSSCQLGGGNYLHDAASGGDGGDPRLAICLHAAAERRRRGRGTKGRGEGHLGGDGPLRAEDSEAGGGGSGARGVYPRRDGAYACAAWEHGWGVTWCGVGGSRSGAGGMGTEGRGNLSDHTFRNTHIPRVNTTPISSERAKSASSRARRICRRPDHLTGRKM